MYNTSKYYSYIYFYANRNIRSWTIQGYTLATFPKVMQYIYLCTTQEEIGKRTLQHFKIFSKLFSNMAAMNFSVFYKLEYLIINCEVIHFPMIVKSILNDAQDILTLNASKSLMKLQIFIMMLDDCD